jgi:hypothetical protein
MAIFEKTHKHLNCATNITSKTTAPYYTIDMAILILTPYLSKKVHQNGDLTPNTQKHLIGTKCHI